MRSFLIRDILSGPTPESSAAAAAAAAMVASAGQDQASSSALETFAATQARFLAEWAEHQQQIQASKYFEQLQQQQHNLLGLATGTATRNHLNLNQLNHQNQLESKQEPHLSRQHQHSNSHKHRLLHQAALASSTRRPASLGAAGAQLVGGRAPAKSTFAYDACGSPISDAGRTTADRDDEETDCERQSIATNDNYNHRDDDAQDQDDAATAADDQDDDDGDLDDDRDQDEPDDDDDDDEEIEVEKVTADERAVGSSGVGSKRRHSKVAGRHSSSADGSSSSGNRMLQQQLVGGDQLAAQFHLNSPLDALFQMTSSTFDALKRGEKRKEREPEHGSNNFNSKQNSKKKRKSRTAFTNNQIYELERRFSMQKYLSPTDRDEIAMTLSLSNAQVITWFQNRRAKLKRDLEEQKRDIETASILNLHKTLFESFQTLSQMANKTDCQQPIE